MPCYEQEKGKGGRDTVESGHFRHQAVSGENSQK